MPARTPISQMLDPIAVKALHELAGKPGVGVTAIAELLATYLSDARDRSGVMAEAIEAGDLGEVRRQAHALAGASGWAGATEVLARCRELEAAAQAGDTERARSLAAGLPRELDAVQTALEAEFGAGGEA